jgi:hypothetical protein
MKLQELYSVQSNHAWTHKDDSKQWVGEFKVKDVGFLVVIEKFKDSWRLEFRVDEESKKKHDLDSAYRLTKLGHEIKVFSIAMTMFREFVEKVKPECIYFSDTDSLPSRTKLYDRIAKSGFKGYKIKADWSKDSCWYLTREQAKQ